MTIKSIKTERVKSIVNEVGGGKKVNILLS